MRRAAAVLALTVLPVLAPPAQALSCPMLTSPEAHLTVAGQPVPVPFAGVDIRSGDLASGPTTVAVVLRLRDLDDLPTLLLGVRWTFGWTIDGTPYAARFDLPVASPHTATFTGPSGTVVVPASADRITDDIRWTIPRGLLPDLATPKRTFRDIHAYTQVLGVTADTATTPATYIDQTAGCIPAS